MPAFEIGDDESRDLLELLDGRLREMRVELSHTDDRGFRRDLRARYDRLEKLRNRLAGGGASTGGEAPGEYFV